MKVIISRKVKFVNPVIGLAKGVSKAESIMNQYVIEGELEDIQHLWLSMIEELKNEFSQVKENK